MTSIRHLATLAPIALLTLAGTAMAADPKKPATPTATSQQTASTERGRDWSQIDTNKDGHVSPEEMEKWLAANPGPLKK